MLDSASLDRIGPAFADSLPELMALYDRAIRYRDTLDQLRQTRLTISTPGGRAVAPDFFKSVLGEANWRLFTANLRRAQAQLKLRLTAA
jgi:hypothetical protein